METLTVARMGAWDPAYPRHRVIDAGARSAGLRVVGRPAPRRGPRRAAAVAGARVPREARAVVVPEFCHRDVAPAAWVAARARVPLVFDPLVGRYETRVVDRGDASPQSLDAAIVRLVDRVTLSLPDLVVADTPEHADYFASLARPGQRFAVVPVGYDERVFDPERVGGAPAANDGPGVTVLFYGSYVPLHGAEVIVRAAARLRGRGDVRFVMLGGGQTFERARREAERSGARVRFEPRVPFDALPARIARADLCLGIFGSGEKARRVVPNKVYQCMGMRRAVITADTPAVRAWFRDGHDLVTVPPGDARALADAVAWLADDAAARERIARAGFETARRRFASPAVAQAFRRAVEAAA